MTQALPAPVDARRAFARQPARKSGHGLGRGARWMPGIALVLAVALGLVGCASTPVPGASPVTDLAGRCSQTEEDGYREDARLDIRDGRVEQLVWQIQVGRKGSCRFHLDQFRQTKSRPHIELVSRDAAGCKLIVYRDSRRVTLGHSDCARQCTTDVIDEAWPVMFDPASGACAKLER